MAFICGESGDCRCCASHTKALYSGYATTIRTYARGSQTEVLIPQTSHYLDCVEPWRGWIIPDFVGGSAFCLRSNLSTVWPVSCPSVTPYESDDTGEKQSAGPRRFRHIVQQAGLRGPPRSTGPLTTFSTVLISRLAATASSILSRAFHRL